MKGMRQEECKCQGDLRPPEWWRLLQYSDSELKRVFLEVFLEFSWLWKIGNLQNVHSLRNDDDEVHGAVCESTRLL